MDEIILDWDVFGMAESPPPSNNAQPFGGQQQQQLPPSQSLDGIETLPLTVIAQILKSSKQQQEEAEEEPLPPPADGVESGPNSNNNNSGNNDNGNSLGLSDGSSPIGFDFSWGSQEEKDDGAGGDMEPDDADAYGAAAGGAGAAGSAGAGATKGAATDDDAAIKSTEGGGEGKSEHQHQQGQDPEQEKAAANDDDGGGAAPAGKKVGTKRTTCGSCIADGYRNGCIHIEGDVDPRCGRCQSKKRVCVAELYADDEKTLLGYEICHADGRRTQEYMEGEHCTQRVEIDAAGNLAPPVETRLESEAESLLAALRAAHAKRSAEVKEGKKRKAWELVTEAAAAFSAAGTTALVAAIHDDGDAALALKGTVRKAATTFASAMKTLESLAPSAKSKGQGRKRAQAGGAKGRGGEEGDEAEEQDLMD